MCIEVKVQNQKRKQKFWHSFSLSVDLRSSAGRPGFVKAVGLPVDCRSTVPNLELQVSSRSPSRVHCKHSSSIQPLISNNPLDLLRYGSMCTGTLDHIARYHNETSNNKTLIVDVLYLDL